MERKVCNEFSLVRKVAPVCNPKTCHSCGHGERMYHEEKFMPDPICKSIIHGILQNVVFRTLFAPDVFLKETPC